ncbi:hypothetical protein ERJ75_000782200 [Trypanosoma vivax]|nr:hypothetical protein ERJ75_000782200 [Trypanosoma vivax]
MEHHRRLLEARLALPQAARPLPAEGARRETPLCAGVPCESACRGDSSGAPSSCRWWESAVTGRHCGHGALTVAGGAQASANCPGTAPGYGGLGHRLPASNLKRADGFTKPFARIVSHLGPLPSTWVATMRRRRAATGATRDRCGDARGAGVKPCVVLCVALSLFRDSSGKDTAAHWEPKSAHCDRGGLKARPGACICFRVAFAAFFFSVSFLFF